MLLWKSQHSILPMTPLLLACCYNCSGAAGLWGRERQGVHRERRHSLAFCRVGRRNFCTEATLPETNFLPLKIGHIPKGNEKVFQPYISRCELLVWGRVLISESGKSYFWCIELWTGSLHFAADYAYKVGLLDGISFILLYTRFFHVSPFSEIPHGSSWGWQLESLIFHDVIMSCLHHQNSPTKNSNHHDILKKILA